MRALSFSPGARQDLIEIGDYIAQDSRAHARRFVDKLIEQCERIALSPFAYPGRDDLAPGLRVAAVGRYVIFFRVIEDGARIERVLHGARDLPGMLGEPQDRR